MKGRRLGDLKKNECGRIISVANEHPAMARRLLQMGFLEGSTVEMIHEAPFGGDPIAVRIRGALVALRRAEANLVEVD